MTGTWIDNLLNSTKEFESPRSFWYWAGLCTISAIVKDNVSLDRQHYTLYPNIYVMLFARSGGRKGPPINFARKAVAAINNTNVISGRSSIQGIMKRLGTAKTTPNQKLMTKASGFIAASELSAALVQDPAAMNILTDLYDRNYNDGDYESLLKMENFSLKDCTLTIFGGINAAHFEDLITSKDLHGGFIGRTFIISETKKNCHNSLVKPSDEVFTIDKFLPRLKELSELKGAFQPLYQTPAGELYDEWYVRISKATEENEYEDKTGTLERIGDSVLKVAMLLSLSRSSDLIIAESDIEESIRVCEKLVGSVRKVTMGKDGKSSYAHQKTKIIYKLLTREGYSISRTLLAKYMSMDLNVDEFDQLMLSFETAGLVRTESRGNQIIYAIPAVEAKKLLDHFNGKGE